jgi:hypothetical protein
LSTNDLPETTHFGFTRIGAGDPRSKNGWSADDLDKIKLDNLIFAALTHTHNGAPALGDPTDPPTFAVVPTGGHLPAATTFYYRCSFVDEHGLETAAGPEGSVTTPNPVAPPTAPAATPLATSGTITPGIYAYLISYTDAYGGETTPSPINNVQVTSGTTNQIRLDLPTMPTGITGYNIYRSRPGQSAFYYVASTTSAQWYDTGIVEDQTITAPTVNSTNAANSIQVTIPLGFIPLGCTSWKIYRATTSGGYDGNSLVHDVTEGATDTSVIPVATWTDTGDVLLAGFPQNMSSTVPSGAVIDLSNVQGSLGLSVLPRGAQCLTAFQPGVPTNGQVVTITDTPNGMKPVRLTAYFKTPPTDTGVTVRFRVQDSAAAYTELACSPTTHQSGDPAGYFHASYPMLAAERFEAESGTLSSSFVIIAPDITASSGQAVNVSTQNGYVQVDLGVLDAGSYHAFITERVTTYAASSTNDLKIEVIRTDTNAVLGTTQYTLLGTDTVETVTINGAPTGGTFTLTFGGQTTSALAYNATAAQVQAALVALSSIGAGNVTVTGAAGGPYTVTFVGVFAGLAQALMTHTDSLTGGTSPSVTVAAATGTATSPLYRELTGPNFTAPGGVHVAIKVSKTANTTQAYNIDSMRFTADVPSLVAGPLTVTAYVDGGTSTSSDVNLAVWF